MRAIILTITFLCVSSLASAQFNQEADKPIYRIEVQRDGAALGTFHLEMFPFIAPKHVRNFDSLVGIQFYDSTAFHRVIPGFMIQGGDPNSRNKPKNTWGQGDPSQTRVPAEFSKVLYVRGILGAARSTDPNSATSQFFVCVATASHLNGQYTVYGKATSGMDVVDMIVNEPRDGADNPLAKLSMVVTKVGVNDTIPEAPVLTSPDDDLQRVGPSQRLFWNSVPNALLYYTEVADDPSFQNIVFQDDSPGGTVRVENLLPGLRKYYWRIRSNNGGHFSPYSEVRSFTTEIDKPRLVSPDSAATDVSVSYVLRWNTVGGAVGYRVQVATNVLFPQNEMVFDQTDIPDTSFMVTGLLVSKRYFWRVSGLTADYEGSFSPAWNFTTRNTTSIPKLPDSPSTFVRVYPQPASGLVTVNYRTRGYGTASLRLIDLLGRTVRTISEGSTVPGDYQTKFDASGLIDGIYVIEFRNGMMVERSTLLVNH